MIVAKTLGLVSAAASLALLTSAFALAAPNDDASKKSPSGARVFEMRTYYTHPGRLTGA